MAEPNKRQGLRGLIKKRNARLGNIMDQIRAGRGQAAKRKTASVPEEKKK